MDLPFLLFRQNFTTAILLTFHFFYNFLYSVITFSSFIFFPFLNITKPFRYFIYKNNLHLYTNC